MSKLNFKIESVQDKTFTLGIYEGQETLISLTTKTNDGTISNSDINLPTYQGATNVLNGVSGLVPAAPSADRNKFLKGDGTWAEVLSGIQDIAINEKTVFIPKGIHMVNLAEWNTAKKYDAENIWYIRGSIKFRDGEGNELSYTVSEPDGYSIEIQFSDAEPKLLTGVIPLCKGNCDFAHIITFNNVSIDDILDAGENGLLLQDAFGYDIDGGTYPYPNDTDAIVYMTDNGNGSYTLKFATCTSETSLEPDFQIEKADGTKESLNLDLLYNHIGGNIQFRTIVSGSEVEEVPLTEYFPLDNSNNDVEPPSEYPAYNIISSQNNIFLNASDETIVPSISNSDEHSVEFGFDEIPESIIPVVYCIKNDPSSISNNNIDNIISVFALGVDVDNGPLSISIEDALAATNGIELNEYSFTDGTPLEEENSIYLFVEKSSEDPYTLRISLGKQEIERKTFLHLEKSSSNNIDLSPLLNRLVYVSDVNAQFRINGYTPISISRKFNTSRCTFTNATMYSDNEIRVDRNLQNIDNVFVELSNFHGRDDFTKFSFTIPYAQLNENPVIETVFLGQKTVSLMDTTFLDKLYLQIESVTDDYVLLQVVTNVSNSEIQLTKEYNLKEPETISINIPIFGRNYSYPNLTEGLVPRANEETDLDKFLKSDGTWAEITLPSTLTATEVQTGTDTAGKLISAKVLHDYATASNTDTKVNVTLGTTTKAYLLGTSTTPTSTASGVTAISDTGVYLDTTAGRLTATSFAGNIENGTLATANAVVVTNASKKLTASTTITTTELGYLDGVTSSIQTQLNGKAASSHNQASSTINAMTGYSKPSSTSAIAATDSLNAAIGKLEKALDGKQASGNYASASHSHDASDINSGTLDTARIPSLDASKITTGTIDIARLPAGALPILKVVGNETERFALTSSDVQVGDTVQQTDTGLMYYVKDVSKLNSADGYAVYTAGAATSVPWSGVTSKPSTYAPSAHNQASNTINAMTGYSKPSSTSAIGTSDTLNAAIGKLEKALDGKQASGSYASASHNHASSEVTAMTSYAKPSNTSAITATDTLNAAIGKLEKALDGKAASSHGTHVTYSTSNPLVAGTASAGSANNVSRGDHVHPEQTIVKQSRGVFLVIPNETTQTATLTATVSGITEYFPGLMVAYRAPFNTAASSTLNINSLGAKPIYYGVNTTSKDYYPANRVVLLVYETTTTSTGCWKMVYSFDGNNNNYDRRLHNNNVKMAAAVAANTIIVGTSAGYKQAASGITFDLAYPILVATEAKAAAAVSAKTYEALPTVNLQTTKASWTGTQYAMAFLVGTLSGNTVTIDSSVFTTTVPSTADGKIYIPIGLMASTYQIFFASSKDVYQYTNGSFHLLDTTTAATGGTNGTVKINGTEIAVKGLGSAAYTASTAYAASSHNQASNTINAMTDYSKPSSTSAIATTDTLNSAIGKLEKALDGKQASGSYAATSHNQASNTINAMTGYSKPSSTSAIGTSDTLNAAIGKLEKALDGKQASGSYLTSSSTLDATKLSGTIPSTCYTDTTYSNFVKSGSTAAAGLVPSPGTTAGTTKFLCEDASWKVPYTHPTTSGNKHIPSGGSSGQFLGWSADGTAAWVANPNSNWTTHLYAGAASNSTANATSATTNAATYIVVCDNSSARNAVQVTGTNGTTVSAVNGKLTIDSPALASVTNAQIDTLFA